jgi:hypothetical protein
LAGDADVVGVAAGEAAALLRACRSAGEPATAGLALAAGDACAFLRPRSFAGAAEASGLAAGAGDVSAFLRPRVLAGDAEASGLLTGAGEVSAFFLRTFLAGEADASGLASGGGPGLCASTREAHEKIIIDTSRARFVVMKRKLETSLDFRQANVKRTTQAVADAGDLFFNNKAATRPTQRKPIISINM